MLTVPLKLDKCLPKLLIHFFRVPMNLWKLKLISENKSLFNIMRHISLYPIIHVHCTVSNIMRHISLYTVQYHTTTQFSLSHCTPSYMYTVQYHTTTQFSISLFCLDRVICLLIHLILISKMFA